MSLLTEPHEPVHDCDCQACACHERDRLRFSIEVLRSFVSEVAVGSYQSRARTERARDLLKLTYTEQPLCSSEVRVGVLLMEKATGRSVKVHQENETDIAWFSTTEEGGVFGQCSRKDALELFERIK